MQQTAENHAVSQLIDSIGGGEPIDRELRELLESRFDADFQQVRIHRDSAAAASAEQLNAVAFTTNIRAIQNASNHGIDIVAERGGQTFFFQVKSSESTILPSLSERQQNIDTFVRSALENSSTQEAKALLRRINSGEITIEGSVLEVSDVSLTTGTGKVRPPIPW